MRSFCFEIIYGILLIVQKGHSTPDGQRVALNVRPLQPKRFFLAKPAVQTEGAEYAGAWFYDYTHQNIDLIGKQSLFLFRFSVRGDFDTLSRIINAQGEPVYGWQISQLKLYEEPLKLEDFSRHGFCGMNGTGVCGNADCENYQPSGNYMEPPTCAIDGCILYEAPQSWCYVEERECSE